MPISRSGFQALVDAVWSLVPVGSRTVTAATVSDKTAYSLTAGSYSIRASSSQQGSFTAPSGTASSTFGISVVTTSRAHLGNGDGSLQNVMEVLGAASITWTHNSGATSEGAYSIAEYF